MRTGSKKAHAQKQHVECKAGSKEYCDGLDSKEWIIIRLESLV